MPAGAQYSAQVSDAELLPEFHVFRNLGTLAKGFETHYRQTDVAGLKKILNALFQERDMTRDLKSVGVETQYLEQMAENIFGDPYCDTNLMPLTHRPQMLAIQLIAHVFLVLEQSSISIDRVFGQLVCEALLLVSNTLVPRFQLSPFCRLIIQICSVLY